ncbi:MAG: hypothetical protein CMP49_01575 [Flavobacteriales bacterium]|nr:hypothetical protein [Flavobacteriales bacterium]
MKKIILLTASVLGFFSVIIGAFGAHFFEEILILNKRLDTFDTASKYHFYHVFLLLFLGVFYDINNKRYMNFAFYFCLIGILLFSGSLYILCYTNNSFFAVITPIGGLCFIFSWFMLFVSIIKKNNI